MHVFFSLMAAGVKGNKFGLDEADLSNKGMDFDDAWDTYQNWVLASFSINTEDPLESVELCAIGHGIVQKHNSNQTGFCVWILWSQTVN